MEVQALIRKIQAQREVWVVLEPPVLPVNLDDPDDAGKLAKRVLVRRPAETAMFSSLHGSRLDSVVRCVVGWDGFREMDLLPAGVGGSDLVPFDPALWAEVVGDHGDWVMKISAEIIDLIKVHQAKKAEAEKN